MRKKNIKTTQSIKQHINTIKRQRITQIFYLPKGKHLQEESIVFLDRINSCDNRIISSEKINDIRLFTLSNYGHYIFLVKLSMHFTRIYENVDRG